MPILQIRDENGNFIPIPAIKGTDGKSAYEQAVEGGYKGTEAEFIAMLNGLTNSEDAAHYADFNNPHKVTAEQVGAIPILYPTSTDLNTELTRGGNRSTIHCYYEITLNTPYKEGKTDCTHGMVITNAHSESYGTQLCMPSGEDAIYVRRLNGGGISEWVKMVSTEQLADHISDTSKHVKLGAGGGASIGNEATAVVSGGAVGDLAYSGYCGFAGGGSSYAYDGGAVGGDTRTSSGFAGGYYARTENDTGGAIDAIQLGTGINKNERTLQVYGYQMMDANGKVPSERLPIKVGEYTGTGTDGYDGELTLTFGFTPRLVLVAPVSNIQVTDKVCYECQPMIMIYGVSDCTGGAQRKATTTSSSVNYTDYVCNAGGIVTWGDNSVSWKSEAEWENKELPAIQVYNYSGVVYRYVAIG